MLQSYQIIRKCYLQQQKARKESNPAGKLCSWLLDRAIIARALRGIPLAIGAGTLHNSKLEMCSVSTVKASELASQP